MRGVAEEGLGAYEFDQDSFDRKYQVMALKVVARRRCTGCEESKEMPVHVGDVIAGRYQVQTGVGQWLSAGRCVKHTSPTWLPLVRLACLGSFDCGGRLA